MSGNGNEHATRRAKAVAAADEAYEALGYKTRTELRTDGIWSERDEEGARLRTIALFRLVLGPVNEALYRDRTSKKDAQLRDDAITATCELWLAAAAKEQRP